MYLSHEDFVCYINIKDIEFSDCIEEYVIKLGKILNFKKVIEKYWKN